MEFWHFYKLLSLCCLWWHIWKSLYRALALLLFFLLAPLTQNLVSSHHFYDPSRFTQWNEMINEVAVAIIIFHLTIFCKVGFICKLKHYGVLVAIDLSSKWFLSFLKLLAARIMNGFNFITGSSFYFLDLTAQCGCLPEAPSSTTEMVDTQPCWAVQNVQRWWDQLL